MKVTKQQAAILQLSDAIELFKNKRYVSSITLAAASEEILAQFLKQHANKTGIPYFTAEEIEEGMFDLFVDFLGIRNYHAYRNNIRNELKHHGESNKDVLTGNFKQIALNHIAGAIQNFKMAENHLPSVKVITDFCLEFGIT